MSVSVILYLILSLFCSTGTNAVKRTFSKEIMHTKSDNLWYSFLGNIVSIAVLIFFGGFKASPYTLFLAFLMGMDHLVTVLLFTKALRIGPLSISTLISKAIILIVSSLIGPMFFAEELTLTLVLGIVCILGSMVLITDFKSDKTMSVRWFVLIALNGIICGFQGLFQKLLVESPYAAEKPGFTFWSFVFAAAVNLVLLLLSMKTGKKESITYKLKGFALFSIVFSGVSASILYVVNLILVESLSTAVFFPINMCSTILLTTLVGVLIFKERMNRRQIIGFVFGIFALLLTVGVFG